MLLQKVRVSKSANLKDTAVRFPSYAPTAERIIKMKNTRISSLIMPMIIIILLTGLLRPVPAEAASSKMKLSDRTLSLAVGATYKLRVENAAGSVVWSTSNKSVARVSSKGRITAKKAGTCKIYAVAGDKKLTCKVTVYNNYSADNGSYRVSGFSTVMGELPLKKFRYSSDADTAYYKDLSSLGSKCSVYFGLTGKSADIVLDSNNYVYFIKNVEKAAAKYPDNPFLASLLAAEDEAVWNEAYADAEGYTCYVLIMRESDLYSLDADNTVFDGDDDDEGYFIIFYDNDTVTDYDCIVIGCDESSFEHITWSKLQ